MHAHGESMAAMGLTEKWLLKEGKVLIRHRVIKLTRYDAPPREDNLENEGTPEPQVCTHQPSRIGKVAAGRFEDLLIFQSPRPALHNQDAL